MEDFLTKNLKIKGYGLWGLYQNGKLIPEADVQANVIALVSDLPSVKRVYNREDCRYMAVTTDYDQRHEDVVFDMGGELEVPLTHLFNGIGLTIVAPRKVSPKEAQRAAQCQANLRDKLAIIPDTDEAIYMRHVNQCGYLVGKTTLDFLYSPNMFAVSVKTRIKALTLNQLRLFVDATGQYVLMQLSTHESVFEEKGDEVGIYSGYKQFAVAIMNFLNLEYIVDIYALADEHKKVKGDTGFLSVEEWGGTRNVVLQRLQQYRPDLDPGAISEYFDLGYDGELI